MSDPAWSHCLVVGSEGGLGAAIVRRLTRVGGGKVSVSQRTIDSKRGANAALAFVANLRTAQDCAALISAVEERNGPIDALVVAIGAIEDYTHFSQIGEQAWSQDLWVNLGAPFFLARAAILSMQSSGRCGRVVLFSSESSRHGSGSHSLAYGAAKAGIDFVARALAKDCAKDGILVNAISPGFVETGFHERWQCKSQLEIEERIEMIPLRRAGTVDEVAGLVEFLLSQDGGFITGTSVSVAGGDWL